MLHWFICYLVQVHQIQHSIYLLYQRNWRHIVRQVLQSWLILHPVSGSWWHFQDSNTNHQHVQRELKTNPLKISWSPAAHHPPLTPTSDGARACTWKIVLLNMPRTKGNIHSLLIKNHWINPLQFEWSRDVEEHWTHGDYPQWWTTLKQLKVILFLLLSC